MKIVVDIRHLTKPNPSGVGQYTLELLKALFALDKENEYILFSSGSNRAKINLPTLDFPNVKFLHLNIPNRLINALLLTTGRPKFDELIAKKIGSHEKLLFFFPNLNIISLTPGTSYILTLHDLSFEIFPKFYTLKDRLWHRFARPRALAQNAKTIIVPSKSAAHDVNLIFGVPEEKIFVIPHGLSPCFTSKTEPQDFGVKSRYHLPKKFTFFIGTLEPRKNISLMIDAVEAYRQKTNDDLHLVLVGKPTKYSQRLAKKPFVHELGYIRSKDIPALYRLAEVTLFPSIYEGFGLPIIESMACGTPVIASKTSSMPEIGSRAAFFVDPHKPEDLTCALQELLSSSELQKEKIIQGLERTKEFTWEKAAQETLKILNKISIN